MGIVVVEVCETNPAASLNLESLEKEFPGVSVIRNDCLSECTLCVQKPFIMINGEIISNEKLENFMFRIRSKIKNELSLWE